MTPDGLVPTVDTDLKRLSAFVEDAMTGEIEDYTHEIDSVHTHTCVCTHTHTKKLVGDLH